MGDEIIRATGYVIRAAKNEDVIRFRASTDVIDRHRSIVKQDGINANEFMRNGSGPFLWGHDSTGGMFGTPDMRNSIGKVVKISKSRFKRSDGKMGRATDIDVEFAKTKESNGPLAASLVREGVLGNVSVAFIPKKHEVREIDGEEIRVYTESELLEVSLVPVASNPEAAQILRTIGGAEGMTFDEPVETDDSGPWFWKDGAWSKRHQAGDLIERIQRVGDVELIERFGQADEKKTKFRSKDEPPPDTNGADTGASEIVSDAVSNWVKAQRRA